MKRILAPILLLTLLFPALAFGETMKDLVKRDGIHYKKFSDVPFTGKVTGEWLGTIINGRKESSWVRYWSEGKLREKVTYKGGYEHGPYVAYHSNGQLWMKTTYKNSAMDGPFERYYANGQLDSKGTYKYGNMEGAWVGFDRNGTPEPLWTGNFHRGNKIK